MGRGDKRTAKGKRFKGSFGNARPQRIKKSDSAAAVSDKPKKAKATKAKKSAAEPKVKKAPAKKAAKKKAE